jgi:mRNA interferase RelE/StbE
MTSYRIEFIPAALREWKKLDNTTRIQFEKKLKQVADNPHILSAKMHGHPNAYRLKARSKGYRLIYEVEDQIVTVFVVAIGKRERGEVFELGLRRLRERDD